MHMPLREIGVRLRESIAPFSIFIGAWLLLAVATILYGASDLGGRKANADGDPLKTDLLMLVEKVDKLKQASRQLSAELEVIQAEAALLPEQPMTLPKPDNGHLDPKARELVWRTVERSLTTRNDLLAPAEELLAGDTGGATVTEGGLRLATESDVHVALHPDRIFDGEFHYKARTEDAPSAVRILFSSELAGSWAICLIVTLLTAVVVFHDRIVGVRRVLRVWGNALRRRAISSPAKAALLILTGAVVANSACAYRPSVDELKRRRAGKLQTQIDRLQEEATQLNEQIVETQRRLDAARKVHHDEDGGNPGELDAYLKQWLASIVGQEAELAPERALKIRDLEDSARGRLRELAVQIGQVRTALDRLAVGTDRSEEQRREYEDLATSLGQLSRKQALVQTGLFASCFFLNGLVLAGWRRRQRRFDPTKVELRFPVLGFAQAGKTLWLAMFHKLVRFGHADRPRCSFERVISTGESDSEFDRILDEVLEQHAPDRTIPGEKTPPPLEFRFNDNDRLGRHSGAMKVYDLAGATMYREMEGSEVQQQVLQMDGFLYFLDPTDKHTTDQQDIVLQHFRDQLRKAHAASERNTVDLPVAVCITKIDLLPKPGNLGADVFQDFINELLEIGNDEEATTLETIRERHSLFHSYLPRFFPGWNLDRQFHNLIGDRYMFFPMTSVGFGELGEIDLKKRNFQPFGIIEPLQWLLHMNGFKTLDRH